VPGFLLVGPDKGAGFNHPALFSGGMNEWSKPCSCSGLSQA
jgi:hypothetical protein